mmetsp:Transcript_29622/g.78016  ORF Transcript_29622/g.78016 Transcript_29622/m.78016 type:complete len:170 (+) Transcript_29622:847-1356(+)
MESGAPLGAPVCGGLWPASVLEPHVQARVLVDYSLSLTSAAGVAYSVAGRLAAPATPGVACRELVVQDSTYYDMGRERLSDWITVWSLNEGNPDAEAPLQPRYFAHPYQIAAGETATSVLKRFGMTMTALQRLNPTVADLASLAPSQVICIVPVWSRTLSASGLPICQS